MRSRLRANGKGGGFQSLCAASKNENWAVTRTLGLENHDYEMAAAFIGKLGVKEPLLL
jgi:hypothetical protein